jgi:hypothetical protein
MLLKSSRYFKYLDNLTFLIQIFLRRTTNIYQPSMAGGQVNTLYDVICCVVICMIPTVGYYSLMPDIFGTIVKCYATVPKVCFYLHIEGMSYIQLRRKF